jgi:hypothetical protein
MSQSLPIASTEVAALKASLEIHRSSMHALNTSYGGKSGGVNLYDLDGKSPEQQLAENAELIEFWEHCIAKAKEAQADVARFIGAVDEAREFDIEYWTAVQASYKAQSAEKVA